MSYIKGNAVLYKGKSKLDGKPIVVVATANSSNPKTGDMLQLWIIRSDINPIIAKKTGEDKSVCGVCPIKKECYVRVFQAPNAIYKSFHKGRYIDLSGNLPAIARYVSGKSVRFGAYGDLAAMPYDLISFIITHCKGHTAYTHQQKHKNFDSRILKVSQVSTETASEAVRISKSGGNTFRIVSSYDDKLNHEIVCLNDSKKLSCFDCMKCNGSKSIVILAHGASGKKLTTKLEKVSKPTKEQLIQVVQIDPEQLALFG